MKAPIGIISEVEQIEEAKVNNRKKKTELTEDGVKKRKGSRFVNCIARHLTLASYASSSFR
jgi:hypothetical protein